MKKRTYQRQKNQLYRTIKRNMLLGQEIKKAEHNAESSKEEAERYKKRLFVLGLDENLEYLPGLSLPTIEAEIPIDTVQYGNWAAVTDNYEQFIDEISSSLTSSIVKGLIKQNLARVIVRKQDQLNPLNDFSTVGVKLTVVPWEQVTSRRLIYKGGYHDQVLSQGENTGVGE